MFDVYILEQGTTEADLPSEGNYYLVTANGIFLHKDTDIVKGLVRVKEIPFLGSIEPKITVKLPKLPGAVVLKAWLFFRKVFRRHRSEAELNLHYNKERDDYLLVCRPQHANFGGVNYGLSREELVEDHDARAELLSVSEAGYRKVGTIHSHCSFGAFHSGIDTKDEAEKDGIHITIGHVDRDNFSLVVSIAVNDNRFPLLPESVIQGVEPTAEADELSSRWMTFKEQASFFKLTMPLEQQEQMEDDFQPTLDEWMEMVSVWRPVAKERRREIVVTAPASVPVAPAPPVVLGEPVGEIIGAEDVLEETRAVLGEPPPEKTVLGEPVPQGDTVPVLAMLDVRVLCHVRSHASALKNNNGKIPPKRVEVLTQTLRDFFKKQDITPDDIDLAARINPDRRVYENETQNA